MVKRVRNKYYREKNVSNTNEETSVILRVRTKGGTFTLLFKSKYSLIYGAKLPHPGSHILKERAKFLM